MTTPAPIDVLVHPATGEILDALDTQAAAVLADALFEVHAKQQILKRANTLLEDELRRRMNIRGRTSWVAGDYELAIEQRNSAEWDGEEVERALRDLIDDGVIDAREAVDVVHHKVEVSRSAINRLLGRLADEHRQRLEQFRSWKRSGAHVTVARSVQLIETGDE